MMPKSHIQYARRNRHFRPILALSLLILVLTTGSDFSWLTMTAIAAPQTQAATSQLEVRIIIENVSAKDEIDGPGSDPDMYAVITLDGQEAHNKAGAIEDESNISPNWQFFDMVLPAKLNEHGLAGINETGVT